MTTILSQPSGSALERIRAIVGPRGCMDDPADVAPYLREERGIWTGTTALMVRPGSTAEVAEIVRVCAETGTPLVPQGGNTGMMAGATPFERGEVLLNLSRMNKIRAIDPLNYTMTVEAGCVLQTLQKAAADADRLFPLSLGAEGTCQIGGNLSTNAGGVQVLRYGMARELALGLEVVLPDGQIVDMLRGLRKDNTGYDLKQLFLGAEGTLGIITAAVLKLFPRPREVETAFIAVRDPEASIELLARMRAGTGDAVTAFELMSRVGLDMVLKHIPNTADPLGEKHNWYVLVECTSGESNGSLRAAIEATLEKALEDELVLDATLAASAQQAQALWRLRESMTESQKPEGGSIKHDVSTPVSSMAKFIDEASAAVERAFPGARPVVFGHVGDGNIHFNVSQPAKDAQDAKAKEAYIGRWEEMNRVVHDLTVRYNGSISAEHGIGRRKLKELEHYKAPGELALMRTLKRALDPRNIMNPGKVIVP